jgi:isovaleryl-CoA dehydrogenase
MDFTWTPRQERLRAEFRDAGRELVRPGAAARDAGQRFERGLWRSVAASGLFGLHLPCRFGGKGWSIADAAAAFEGFAAGAGDIGFLVAVVSHMGLVQSVLQTFGKEDQQQRWLPGLIDGSLLGCFAITEQGGGSDIRAMQLAAHPDNSGGWRLNGAKWSVTNAPAADVCITFAKLQHRAGKPVTAFLADLRQPGVTASAPFDLMGNRTTPVGELVFKDYHVPAGGLLGEAGRGLRVLDFAFVMERILTGIGIAGCLDTLIDSCMSRVEERKAFGRPIGDNQYVQGHIVEMYTDMELLRSTAWRALDCLVRRQDCAALASVVKMTAAEAFHRATVGALRIHGNHGYRRGTVVERFCRDAPGLLLAGGTSEIHKTIIWRNLQRGRGCDSGAAESAQPTESRRENSREPLVCLSEPVS